MIRYFHTLLLFFIFFGCISVRMAAQHTPPRYINGFVVPSDLPAINPTTDNSDAEGRIFISNWTGSPYVMIYETDGTPYFYQRTENISIDFKVHDNGVLSRNIRGDNGSFVLMDSNFNYIDTIRPKNGYGNDHHDFQITPEGTFLLMPIENKYFDISGMVSGGGTNVRFRGNHIQEIDQDGNLLFEWICWDHFELTDTYRPLVGASFVDFTHMNSVGVDYDGHLIISCRSLNECTKIDRTTGDIIWRFGGKNNQFTMPPGDTLFRIQHDIRAVPGYPNHYTLFDNNIPRAVEYYLDTVSMTAEKIWEYSSPERSSPGMGNAQRLDNGNTLINWAYGSLPKCTEVTAAGEVVYEISHDYESYRTFRFDWNGVMNEPYLTAEKYAGYVRAIYHKFGDTLVDHYNIYLSTNSGENTLYTSTDSCWYDIDFKSLNSYTKYYLKISAVNTMDEESDFSQTYEFLTGLTDTDDMATRGNTPEAETTDPGWISSHYGNALDFDGEDDLASCGNSVSLQINSKDITLEALVSIDTIRNLPAEQNIINKEDESSGYKLFMTEGGAVGFYIGDGITWYGITSEDSVLTVGEWTHVAATYNEEEFKIYVDGELLLTGTATALIDNTLNPLCIGSSYLNAENSFDGKIDEVRVWNTERTQEQLIEFMETELECKEPELMGYWRFNEGEGQTVANLIFDSNVLLNGDFSESFEYWDFVQVDATAMVIDEGLEISIIDAGNDIESTQLIQQSIQVVEGSTYELSFTAHAEEERFMGVKVQQSIMPYDDYLKAGLFIVTEDPEEFSFDFTMEEPSDFNARLAINMGNEAVDVTISDISFGLKLDNIPPCFEPDTNDPGDTTYISDNIVTAKQVEAEFYPNPVQSGGILKITSAEPIVISYMLIDCMGKKIDEKSCIEIPEGEILIPVNCSSYPDGIYFMKIITDNLTHKKINYSTIRILKN